MKTTIYYFSGTGNSLHIARNLQKKIPCSEIIPIISLIDEENIKPDADAVGFVFPVHFANLSDPMPQFIKKLDLSNVSYLFAVTTRFGTTHRAFNDIDKLIGKMGRSLDAAFNIIMPCNDTRFRNFMPPTEDEVRVCNIKAQNKLDFIGGILEARKKYVEMDKEAVLRIPSFILNLIPFIKKFSLESDLYHDDKCKSCGNCAKICPSGKIRLINNKPVWLKEVKCFTCDACVNFCPERSVQIRSGKYLKFYTEYNERYNHPFADFNDIAGQKKQDINQLEK